MKYDQRIKLSLLYIVFILLMSNHVSAAEISLSITPEKIYPGRLVIITMSTMYSLEKIQGDVEGHTLYFNKIETTNTYQAFWPIDLEDHLGRRTVKITTTLKDTRTLHYSADFDVVDKEYGRRDLEFEKTYDQKTLNRINSEKDKVTHVLEKVSQKKLWEGSFIKPVEGPMSGEFGKKTFVQGEERSPHAGIDFAAPVGAKIQATNDGIVAFTDEDFYFEGKIILIDHGQGLFSIYVHLSKISVTKGQKIKKGDIIGEVGQTGRAAGAHLHFATKLFNKRISPEDILSLVSYEVPNV